MHDAILKAHIRNLATDSLIVTVNKEGQYLAGLFRVLRPLKNGEQQIDVFTPNKACEPHTASAFNKLLTQYLSYSDNQIGVHLHGTPSDLYDIASSLAHGDPAHNADDKVLREAANMMLLRKVIMEPPVTAPPVKEFDPFSL